MAPDTPLHPPGPPVFIHSVQNGSTSAKQEIRHPQKSHSDSHCQAAKILIVTVHEKIRCKSKIVSLDDAHLKVQALCCYMLKSDWPNEDKITSV